MTMFVKFQYLALSGVDSRRHPVTPFRKHSFQNFVPRIFFRLRQSDCDTDGLLIVIKLLNSVGFDVLRAVIMKSKSIAFDI
jgi:hypothetical protein